MNITLAIPGVTGTSIITGHAGEVVAIGMADALRARASRNDTASVSETLVWRHRDKASPVLAHACAAATNLGSVTVNLFENNDQGSTVVFATYVLTNTFISRYEMDTADTDGIAYELHLGSSGEGSPWGKATSSEGRTINDARYYARVRARVTPKFPRQYGAGLERAVERLWLSCDTITWTYADGGISKGWNIGTGAALAA